MRLTGYLIEEKIKTSGGGDGTGADGLSKQKLKTMIYKATKNFTRGIYSDDYWKGPQEVWDAFNKLNLNWYINKAEYRNNRDDAKMGIQMPTSKVWDIQINWKGPKGKDLKMKGQLTASGAGSMKQPLEKYDIVLILF